MSLCKGGKKSMYSFCKHKNEVVLKYEKGPKLIKLFIDIYQS